MNESKNKIEKTVDPEVAVKDLNGDGHITKKEMEMERGEFMYDPKKGQIRLRKTDDADQPIEMRSPLDMMMPGRSPLNGKKDACYHKVKSSCLLYTSTSPRDDT